MEFFDDTHQTAFTQQAAPCIRLSDVLRSHIESRTKLTGAYVDEDSLISDLKTTVRPPDVVTIAVLRLCVVLMVFLFEKHEMVEERRTVLRLLAEGLGSIMVSKFLYHVITLDALLTAQ